MPRVTLPVSGKDGTGTTLWAGGHSSEPHCPHGHLRLPFSTPTHGPLANAWISSQPSGPLHLLFHLPGTPFLGVPCLANSLPLPEEVEASHLGSLTRTLCLAGPCLRVNFWKLLHCGMYVSVSPFDFRLPEGRDLFLFISVSLHPAQGPV